MVQSTKDEKNDCVSMQSHTVCTANVDISMWTKRERPALGWLTGRAMERVHGSMTRGLSSPATTHCDEDRSCQWIHGAGISSQNLRKPTEATADPQLLELNLKH